MILVWEADSCYNMSQIHMADCYRKNSRTNEQLTAIDGQQLDRYYCTLVMGLERHLVHHFVISQFPTLVYGCQDKLLCSRLRQVIVVIVAAFPADRCCGVT